VIQLLGFAAADASNLGTITLVAGGKVEMADRAWDSIPAMFFDWAARKGDVPLFHSKRGKSWVAMSWRQAAASVTSLAGAFQKLGVQPGDRVAIVADNQAEWIVADLAIMAVGAITVPAYTSYTTEDYRHVLADSGARIVIVGSSALGKRLLPAADQLSEIRAIVALEPLPRQSHADIFSWEAALALGAASAEPVMAAIRTIQPDDTACLIYTSGTGGVPKGVMLTHRNLLSNAAGAERVLGSAFRLQDESFLSFLPLTHSYEHTAGLVFPLSIGAEIHFTTPEALATDMVQVKPTIMTAVPRLFETLQKRILQAAERRGGWRLTLFRKALELGRRRYGAGPPLGLGERLLDRLLDLLVRRTVGQRLGGRLKAFVSGGAPLNRDVALFFLALGVRVVQGYGQTESGPVVCVNPPNRIKVDTVGPPLERIELRIAEDGEVLVRGPNVMKGYWRDPETTERTIREGWLHTGDIGALDADGYLSITDRKRDFIKTTGGDMIAPQRLEGMLTMQEGIAQAMVHGDREAYLVALIVPDSVRPDGSNAAAPGDDDLRGRVAAAVAAVNRGLTSAERIRRHAILSEPFTVENGMMTPTLKIKRHAIRLTHANLLAQLYDPSRSADA
jgi:long-chain acyl-CoA synthetase